MSCAAFTVVRNDPINLAVWIRYYSRHMSPMDIWVLDHNSTDGSMDPRRYPPGINFKQLHGATYYNPLEFLREQVEFHQKYLLHELGYMCAVFAESDEMLVPDPARYPGGE